MNKAGIKAKRYDANVYQLLDGEKVVGFAMKLATGDWGMCDTEGRRINRVAYPNPQALAAAFAVYPR